MLLLTWQLKRFGIWLNSRIHFFERIPAHCNDESEEQEAAGTRPVECLGHLVRLSTNDDLLPPGRAAIIPLSPTACFHGIHPYAPHQ